MKKLLMTLIFYLLIVIFSAPKVSAEEYAFSAGGYDYTVYAADTLDYSVMYGGSWDKVYPVIVGVYKNKLPHSSLVFVFAQKDGAWYYNIKNVSTNFAPVSSNSGAQAVFNILQKELAKESAQFDRKVKAYELNNIAVKYLEAKAYNAAINAFQEYQKFYPENNSTNYNIALCYLGIANDYSKAKNYTKAVENCEKARTVFETYKTAFLNKNPNETDVFDKAYAKFYEALNKSFALSYKGIPVSYYEAGNKETAIEYAKKCQDYGEYFILPEMQEKAKEIIADGDALCKKKDYLNAIEIYKSAFEYTSEKHHEIYFKIALSYRKLKDYDNALWYIEKAIRLAPPNSNTEKEYLNRKAGWEINQRLRNGTYKVF